VYADAQAYFAACYCYHSLQPLLTRFNRQDLDDLYTQTLLQHYFITIKTYYDVLWPLKPDIGLTQAYLLSRRTPEMKRTLAKIEEKQEYSMYRDLVNRGGEMAKRELILEKNSLEGIVTEIKATLQGPPSQIDLEIAKLENEVEEINTENSVAISE
jgi:hypothetical protein